MTEAIQVRQTDALAAPMSAQQVTAQVQVIQEIMQAVMVDKTHYGTIPGCGDKKVLFLPGAQKLGMTFHLVPKYTIEREDLPNGHREYEVTCDLYCKGELVGSGVGTCSTMEKKYRYRNGQENPDIADTYNTVKKIGKKRAYVDGVLTTTGASDIFTQDIGDPEADKPKRPAPKAPQRRSESGDFASEAQCKMLWAVSQANNVPVAAWRTYLKDKHGANSSKDIPKSAVDTAKAWLEMYRDGELGMGNDGI